jgi:hypothetical protein
VESFLGCLGCLGHLAFLSWALTLNDVGLVGDDQVAGGGGRRRSAPAEPPVRRFELGGGVAP